MKPQQNVPMPPAAPVLLTYGTHDRSGPWWQRWLRAWGRAAKPALIAAAVAGALAYSVAPRQYTAVATVQVEPDLITQARGNTTSADQDTERAVALARSLKNTNYLAAVLNSAEWRNARFAHPGQTLFEPISAEPVPGTKTVRVRFTDPNPEAARAGAEATVTALRPIDDTSTHDPVLAVQQKLGPLEERERQLRVQLAAAERDAPVATQPAPRISSSGRLSSAQSRTLMLSRQLMSVQRQRAAVERQLAATPQVRRAEPAAVPRFASNQKELAATGVIAAGVVFPLAFLLALVHAWRYARTATTQTVDVDRIMSVADLTSVTRRSRGQPLWSAMRRALAPAAVAAAIAAAVACSFAPRRYTATATIIAAPPIGTAGSAAPSTAPAGTATPAEAIAALAEMTARPEVFRQVTSSQQWQVAKVRDVDSRANGLTTEPRIDVSREVGSLVVRFTDSDRDAARYGAEAALNAARGMLRRFPTGRNGASLQPQLQQLRSVQARMPAGSNPAIDASVRQLEMRIAAGPIVHSEAVLLAVAQLPAAVTSAPAVPSNYVEMLNAAVAPAAWTFALVFFGAMFWIRRREVRVALRRAAGEPRLAAAATSFKPAVQLATIAAAIVGIVAYAATPRTYTAAATLQVYALPPAPAPKLPPGATPVFPSPVPAHVVTRRLGERALRIVPSAAVRTDLDKGAIRITYTDPDPDVAASCANAIASSVVQTWRKNFDHPDLSMLFGDRGAKISPANPRELEEWSRVSAGCDVKVADAAKAPSWADQVQPLKTSGVVAVAAFLSVLFAIELLRAPRTLREQIDAEPVLA